MAKEKPATNVRHTNNRQKATYKKEPQGASSYSTTFFIPHILIIVAALIVYAGTLNHGFLYFDDDQLFQNNAPVITEMTMKNIRILFSNDAFLNPVEREFYRPFQTLSYMFDMQISDNIPMTFLISNLIIHCLACLALYHMLILLKFDRWFSLAGALLYTVHPLFCMAVSWMPGRGDLLLGLFVSMSFVCFIKYIDATSRTYSILFLGCSLCLYVLALFSKETAIVLPVILALYYVLEKIKMSKGLSIKDNVLLLYPIVGWIMMTIVWYSARRSAISAPIPASRFGTEPFIANLATIPEFIAKFIVPINIAPIPRFSSVATVLGLALMAVLMGLTVIKKDKDSTKILLGIAWFLLFLFPGMSYRHLLGDTAYSYLNHRAYLPMMGMLIFIFSIIPHVQQINSKIIVIPGALIVTIFSLISMVQTRNYSNAIAFYSSAIEANPQSAYCYNNRGRIFAANGELEKSLADFNKALEINPEDDLALSNRGNVKNMKSDYQGALVDLREAIRLRPDSAAAYNNIGITYYKLNRMTEALTAYNKAIEIHPGYDSAYLNRALIKTAAHDRGGAIEDYSKAIAISPNNPIMYAKRAMAYFNAQELEKACNDWKHAAERGDGNSLQILKATCQGAKK